MESVKDVGKNVEVNKIQEAWKLVTILATTNEAYCEEYDSVKVKLVDEIVDKATPKKPLIKYYGEAGNKSTKVCCPNGCGIQLNGLDKEGESRAYTNDYCNKCGQAIDWSKDE